MAAAKEAAGGAAAKEAARGVAAGGAVVSAAAEGAVGGAAVEVGGGEDRRTGGQKALPPRVFTILEPEKEKKKGRGASEIGNGM